nr:hypothetical protein [Candidatus Sigynarchaeota archaeon]
MKSANVTVMDRLRDLYNQGRFKDIMNELRHYLGTITYHSRSPFVLDLLDLFKKVIDKDLDCFDENLKTLEILFNMPGLDVQGEILAVFEKISSIPGLKQKLFDRYFEDVKTGFSVMSTESKAMILDILDNISRGSQDLQEKFIKFLLTQVDGADTELLLKVLTMFVAILGNEPDLERTFDDQLARVLDRFAFESDSEVEKPFQDLFIYLPSYRDRIVQTSVQWLLSRDYRLKEKALKLIPVVIEGNMDIACFNTLIDNLNDDDPEFQSSVVEALSKIVARNVPYYLTRVMKRFSRDDLQDNEIQGFIELFTNLASNDFDSVFMRIFASMQVKNGSCEGIALEILKNMNYEYPKQLEAAIFKVTGDFPDIPAGKKEEVLEKVHVIVTALNSEIVILWFAKFLKELRGGENTPDNEVERNADEMLHNLYLIEPKIDEKLVQIQERIRHIEDNIAAMKNYPRLLRERGDLFVEGHDKAQGLKLLDAEYHALLDKLFEFDNFINKLEFKHLILDLVDEWHHAKDYILDDLNVVKDYLENAIGKKIQGEEDDLDRSLKQLDARRHVLLAEFDEIIARKGELKNATEADISKIASSVGSVMTGLLLHDLEISKMRLGPLGQLETYTNLVKDWEAARENMEHQLEDIKTEVDWWLEQKMPEKNAPGSVTVDSLVLQKFFTSYVRSSIQDFKTILDDVQAKNDNIMVDLASKHFEDVEKSINFKKSKLLDLIEDKAYFIEKYWRRLNQASRNIEFIMSIGRLKDEWLTTKANIIEKVQRVYHEQMERVDAEKIKQMLQIVNPIPVDSLKSKIKSIQYSNDVEYIEGILNIVQKYQINAQVQKKAVINLQDYLLANQQQSYLRIKTSTSSKGDLIVVKILVENTSIQDLYDINISLKLPSFLDFKTKRGESKRQTLASLEPGKNATFTWEIEEKPYTAAKTKENPVQSSKISILIGGKLAGDRHFNKVEDICFIYKKS